MDQLKSDKKREEVEKVLLTFYLKCTKIYGKHECPLDKGKICSIYEDTHSTNECPILPSLKNIFQMKFVEMEEDNFF